MIVLADHQSLVTSKTCNPHLILVLAGPQPALAQLHGPQKDTGNRWQ
jgi:hypothetical protein